MKKHLKIYLEGSGYGVNEFIPCEICSSASVDIHHIEPRGMGGDPKGKKDVFENLMAVCRECHIQKGDKKQFKEELKEIHKKRFNLK